MKLRSWIADFYLYWHYLALSNEYVVLIHSIAYDNHLKYSINQVAGVEDGLRCGHVSHRGRDACNCDCLGGQLNSF